MLALELSKVMNILGNFIHLFIYQVIFYNIIRVLKLGKYMMYFTFIVFVFNATRKNNTSDLFESEKKYISVS